MVAGFNAFGVVVAQCTKPPPVLLDPRANRYIIKVILVMRTWAIWERKRGITVLLGFVVIVRQDSSQSSRLSDLRAIWIRPVFPSMSRFCGSIWAVSHVYKSLISRLFLN